MSKVSVINSTKYQLEVSAAADMFIVPNPIFMLKDLNNISTMVKIDKFTDDNKSYVTPLSDICQIWLTSPDLHSENISDHGIMINIDDNDLEMIDKQLVDELRLADKFIFCRYTSFMEFMPVSLIKDMKENDTKEFVYNISIPSKLYCNKEFNIKLNLNITAKQLAYRYCRFGKFEDVVKRLID